MKSQTALAIIAVCVTLGVGFLLLTRNVSFRPEKIPSPVTPSPTPLETVQTRLTLSPQQDSVAVGETLVYNVSINTLGKGVLGVETYFNYDPKMLTIISLKPENFLKNPIPLIETIDKKQGKIGYALGGLEAVQGTGILFKIQTKVIAQPTGVINPLMFDQTNTKVALESVSSDKRYLEEQTVVVFEEKPLSILL